MVLLLDPPFFPPAFKDLVRLILRPNQRTCSLFILRAIFLHCEPHRGLSPTQRSAAIGLFRVRPIHPTYPIWYPNKRPRGIYAWLAKGRDVEIRIV